MSTPSMYYGHPVYRIPSGYDATKRMFLDSPGVENIDPETGDMLVFSTWLTPDTPIPDGDREWWNRDDDMTLADFVPEYTPTPEEVMRALRGPMGPTGPMGPMGMDCDRSEPAKNDELVTRRMDDNSTKESMYNLNPHVDGPPGKPA